jgi:AraC-like DNA-binding protein
VRLGLLERAIAERVAAAPPLAPELHHAWSRLERTRGSVPAATLAAEVGWSRRHLAATLHEHAGLPPKSLARVLRFEHAAARLRRPGDATLADLALDCGFYDQAHLNRDFRKFAGMTPAQYREVTSVQDSASVAA